jgi:hypothetical protein
MAVVGCAGWRHVVEGITAADTQAARDRTFRAKTDRSDARLLRVLLENGALPESAELPVAARKPVIVGWRMIDATSRGASITAAFAGCSIVRRTT